MRVTDLFEAINTAGIDRAARKALDEKILQYVKDEWEHISSQYGEDEDRSEIYDAWYQQFRNSDFRRQTFIRNICRGASIALEGVVHDALAQEFPSGKINIDRPDVSYSIAPSDVRVKVEAREYSSDEHSRYDGYFRSSSIACFVLADDVFTAASGMLQEWVFGDGYEADLLTRIIAPVFVHEFTHLLQFLRGGSRTDRDFGYISVHGGKRGGRRDPGNRYGTTPDNRSAWLRYKSSANEIESFAADAASTIIADLERHRQRGTEEQEIRNVLTDISMGYDNSGDATSHYRELTLQHMEGAFHDLGVPEHEIMKMWKRYLKLIYQKLWTYSAGRMGRTPDTSWTAKYPKNWRQAAQRGISFAAAYLANEVASEQNGNRRYDMQSQASTFLELYFFGEEYGYDFEQSMKVTRAFNRLVDKAIDRQNDFGA